jgi:hypothetical protein
MLWFRAVLNLPHIFLGFALWVIHIVLGVT